jgi:hypothetical protein
MASKLWLAVNATPSNAALTSTQSTSDSTPVPASSITHTGGKDNNFISIPLCSDSRYYTQHHILIKSNNWVVALWTDDDNKNLLYWSPGDYFTNANPIPNSVNYDSCGIIIVVNGTTPTVFASEWYGCD